MNATVQSIRTNISADSANAEHSSDGRSLAQRVSGFGDHVLLASTVTVLVWIGAMKFTGYEAGAIEGLVASSPLTAWLYSVFSLQGASNLIGTLEIATALMLLIGIRYKSAAILGALAAIATFTVTLSFLFTAPGWEASLGGFPALSVVPGQFLLKDIVLLGAAITLLGKALSRKS